MTTVILTRPVVRIAGEHAQLGNHPIYGVRPLLRGRFHQAAALVSIPTGLQVVTQVASPNARTTAVVYALTCTLMFATSAAYHRLAQGIRARFWMRRLDHSMILVHMAGGTTPVAVFGLGGAPGRMLLVTAWSLAGVGVVVKMTRLTADRDPGACFFGALGLLPLLAVPGLAVSFDWQTALLLSATTGTYGAGAVCFARKSPDPIPMVFGFHELWHVFTLVAAVLQLLLTSRIVAVA